MRRFILLLVFISLSSIFTFLNSKELSLEDAINLGLEKNKLIEKSKIELENADKLRKSYKTNFLPKLSFSANYLIREEATEMNLNGGYLPTYLPDQNGDFQPNLMLDQNGSPIIGADGNPVFNQYAYLPDIEAEVLPKSGFIAGLSLKQPIYKGGKISTAYKVSKIGLSIADLKLVNQQENLIIEVSEAYWQVKEVKEKLNTAKKYNEMLKNLVKDISNAMDSGLRTRNELLKAQVKFNETELMVQKAKNGLILSKMLLAEKIGLEYVDIEIISDQANSHILNFDNSYSYENRTDFRILKKAVKISKEKVKIARSDFLPQLGLQANYSNIDYELNGEKTSSMGYTVLANFSVPVFEWFNSSYKVGIAKNENKLAELDLDYAIEMMNIDIQKRRFDYEEAMTALEISQLSLQQTEENLRITKNNYDSGRETLTELLETQSTWQKMKSNLIEAQKSKAVTELYFKKAVGILIDKR